MAQIMEKLLFVAESSTPPILTFPYHPLCLPLYVYTFFFFLTIGPDCPWAPQLLVLSGSLLSFCTLALTALYFNLGPGT
jgi:hypothetical protein